MLNRGGPKSLFISNFYPSDFLFIGRGIYYESTNNNNNNNTVQ